MENLLDVFDSITITNVDRISDEDKAYCEDLQKRFDKSMDQVLKWYAFFKKKTDEDTEHLFRMRYGKPEPAFPSDMYSRPRECRNLTFGKYEYTPLAGLSKCTFNAGCMCEEFENRIVEYFNKTYGVSLNSENKLPSIFFGKEVKRIEGYERFDEVNGGYGEDKVVGIPEKVDVPRYDVVIDYIIEQLGGQSFIERKNAESEKNIADHWEYKELTLKGRNVTIGWCAPVETWMRDRPQLSYDFGSAFGRVMDAIALVEKSGQPFMYGHIDREESFGKIIPILGSVTAESFKFFKNRNLTVTFISEEAAKTFYDTVKNIIERYKNNR